MTEERPNAQSMSPDAAVRAALAAFEREDWDELLVLTDQQSLERFSAGYRQACLASLGENPASSATISEDLADVSSVDAMMMLSPQEFLRAWGKARTRSYRASMALARMRDAYPAGVPEVEAARTERIVVGSVAEHEGRALVVVREGMPATQDYSARYQVIPVEAGAGEPWRLVMSHEWLGLGGPLVLVPSDSVGTRDL